MYLSLKTTSTYKINILCRAELIKEYCLSILFNKTLTILHAFL